MFKQIHTVSVQGIILLCQSIKQNTLKIISLSMELNCTMHCQRVSSVNQTQQDLETR